jgi:hypothetical protein
MGTAESLVLSPSTVISFVIFAVIMTVGFAFVLVRTTTKLIDNEKHALLTVVVFGFAILLGIYVSDKLIAFKMQLLTPEESTSVFNLIKDVVMLVFGYYFGVSRKK